MQKVAGLQDRIPAVAELHAQIYTMNEALKGTAKATYSTGLGVLRCAAD